MTMRSFGLAIVFAAVVSPTPPCVADKSSYVIEPADVLRVEVIGIDLAPNSVEGEHTVHPDGTISLGAYGTVKLNGMSVPKARTAIKEFLVSRAAPDGEVAVCLEVVAHDSKVCYIVVHDEQGEQVSRIRWNANETVAAAVLRVEGLAATAAKDGICIARPLARSIRMLAVDWQAITQEGRLATNHKLQPGDRIFVGQSPSK